MHVSLVTILGNVLLSAFKLAAGIFAHSGAMVSDAVHSASDVLSTFVVIAGVKLSGKDSDKEHPYGHERFECVAAILLAVMLAATGFGIGWAGIRNITGDSSGLAVPGGIALVAAVISIVSKEAMYWYTRAVAKKNRLVCFDGRCLAPSLRCAFLCRQFRGYLRRKTGIPGS